MKVDLCISCEL